METGTLDFTFLERIHDSGWESMVTAFKPTEYGKMVGDALVQIEHPCFLAILDACGSQYLIDYLRRVKQQCFGIEPVLAFYLARDHELKVVRTLWMGKAFAYAGEKLPLRAKTLF
jgi:vacuolar-type H+-ATPase subunit C/Vma6